MHTPKENIEQEVHERQKGETEKWRKWEKIDWKERVNDIENCKKKRGGGKKMLKL